MNNEQIKIIALILVGIGMFFIILFRFIFKARAYSNRKAWNGGTALLLLLGMIFFSIGLTLLFITNSL